MHAKNMLISIVLCLISTASFAATETRIVNPDQLEWKPVPNYPEVKYTILAGNPLKNEYFVSRIKLPKQYDDVVHEHGLTRYDTIISGNYYFGTGDKADKSKTQKIEAGTFIECKAHVKHFGYTEDETVIQISGMGPWEVIKSSGKAR